MATKAVRCLASTVFYAHEWAARGSRGRGLALGKRGSRADSQATTPAATSTRGGRSDAAVPGPVRPCRPGGAAGRGRASRRISTTQRRPQASWTGRWTGAGQLGRGGPAPTGAGGGPAGPPIGRGSGGGGGGTNGPAPHGGHHSAHPHGHAHLFGRRAPGAQRFHDKSYGGKGLTACLGGRRTGAGGGEGRGATGFETRKARAGGKLTRQTPPRWHRAPQTWGKWLQGGTGLTQTG